MHVCMQASSFVLTLFQCFVLCSLKVENLEKLCMKETLSLQCFAYSAKRKEKGLLLQIIKDSSCGNVTSGESCNH